MDCPVALKPLYSVRHRLLRRSCAVEPFLHFAVLASVEEINEQSDDQPNDQTDLRCCWQSDDQGSGKQDCKDRCHWHPRRTEWAYDIRMRPAHDPDTGANQNEGEQRTDAGHLIKDAQR